jgi:monomeric isocitrate dehydrogenase
VKRKEMLMIYTGNTISELRSEIAIILKASIAAILKNGGSMGGTKNKACA